MEDSPEASFAGLQDSYLAVRGADSVLDRVRSCWASLYNDESVSYRRRRAGAKAAWPWASSSSAWSARARPG